MDLVHALAGRDVVSVVGAGGKKTTLWTLAARHDRAVVTAATRIPPFDDRVSRMAVTDDPVEAVESALAAESTGERPWPLGVVPGRADDTRYEGYDTGILSALAETVGDDVDAILVKADGARGRLFKAPDQHEPQVAEATDTVLPIVSAKVVGETLSGERVHRPERVAELAEVDLGEEIRPVHVARVVASDRGGLKGVPDGAAVVPVVNMCDDEELTAVGREVAEEVLERAGVPRVALARMNLGELVDVVE